MKRVIFVAVLLITGTSILSAAPDFSKESTLLISSGAPQSATGSFPSARMYFIRDYRVLSATSSDGLSWSVESGIRVSTATTPLIAFSSITACSVLELAGGGYRMLYSVANSPTEFRIHSATSSDGLNWANDSGTRVEADSGATFVGSPRLVEDSGGDWLMYYLEDNNGGNDPADYRVFQRTSSDEGLTWSSETSVIQNQAGAVGTAVRTDNQIRVLITAPLTGETTNSQVLSALSTTSDGTSFNDEDGVRLSTDSSAGDITSLALFRSTESFRWRLYYGFQVHGSTTPHIYNAITSTPDPTGLTPNGANRSDPALQFQIAGEIFSSTPTAKLAKSGETDIVGSGLTRNSDQSLTVTFDINGKTIGYWDLVVTNDDGVSNTVSNAFLLSFLGGNVVLTDNVFRPLNGESVQIEISVFADGNVSLKIYTLDGRLVKTVLDAPQTAGTLNVSWDGTNDQGERVASGVYLLKSEGPKLDDIQKIVVIK